MKKFIICGVVAIFSLMLLSFISVDATTEVISIEVTEVTEVPSLEPEKTYVMYCKTCPSGVIYYVCRESKVKMDVQCVPVYEEPSDPCHNIAPKPIG